MMINPTAKLIIVLIFLAIDVTTFSVLANDEREKTRPVHLSAIEKYSDLMAAIKASNAKVVLLQIWAVGCSRCMAEMPQLVRASTDAFGQNKDVAFLGLSVAPDDKDAKSAIEAASAVVAKKEIPYKNLVWTGDGAILREKLNVQGTPYTALFSADGTLLGELELPRDSEKADAAIKKAVSAALEHVVASQTKPPTK